MASLLQYGLVDLTKHMKNQSSDLLQTYARLHSDGTRALRRDSSLAAGASICCPAVEGWQATGRTNPRGCRDLVGGLHETPC